MNTFKMPAGTYYVGDLCYVMHDRWDEFCSTTITGNECRDGKFAYPDGVTTCHFGTYYGDGVYEDQYGNSYPVDAGLIGIIKVSDIKDETANLKDGDLGNIIEFHSDFDCYDDDGILHFGHIRINTKDEESDEDEENYDTSSDEDED